MVGDQSQGQMDDAQSPELASASGSTMHVGHGHGSDHQSSSEGHPNVADLDPVCGGCKQAIDQESGGVVVAFGASLWHTDCFRCAKCKERVTADTNLLLLSDGSPVCGNCSYQCFVCKQAITEEAIMTGDESYHAHCFTCRSCSRRIEELVFAKTSQGIYCMACHNERVARSRRHAEAKRNRAARKEKEKEREKERERERERDHLDQAPAPLTSDTPAPSPASAASQPSTSTVQGLASPIASNLSQFSTPAVTPVASNSDIFQEMASAKDFDPQRRGLTSPLEIKKENSELNRSPLRSRTQSHDRERIQEIASRERTASSSETSKRLRQETLPLPSSPSGNLAAMRRKSFDESARAPAARSSPIIHHTQSPSLGSSPSVGGDDLSVNPAVPSRTPNIGLGVGPVGLGVPMTKAERRRSINPGMTFNLEAETLKADGRLTPLPPSPLRASFTEAKPIHQFGDRPRTPTSPSTDTLISNPLPTVSTQPATPRPLERDLSESSLPPRQSDQLSDVSKSPIRSADSTDRIRHESPSRRPPTGPRNPSSSSARSVSNRDITVALDSPTRSSGRQTPTVGSFEHSRSTTPANDGATNEKIDAPRINAPALPPMSFSLSDPDFALLLNDIHVTPHRDGEQRNTPSTGSTIRVDPKAPMEASMVISPTLQRSPQMSTLSSAVNGDASMLPPRVDSRGRLYEAKSDTPQHLRKRQVSSEFTTSLDQLATVDSVRPLLSTLLAGAKEKGDSSVELDARLLERVVRELEDLSNLVQTLKTKYSGARRSSQQYSEGLNVAGEEYDKEVALRREAEAEVTRLRAQLHGQTARLSVISGDERRQESMRRRSHDLALNLSGLEKDISKLRAQRDISLAEVEELEASKSNDHAGGSPMDMSLTSRLDTIKEQYKEELEPLTAQREALLREISELRDSRDLVLEESSSLAAKNEELAELNAQLKRQAEILQDSLSRQRPPTIFNKARGHPTGSPSLSSLATTMTLHEAPEETARVVKVTKPETLMEAAPRKFKWYKSSKGPEPTSSSASISKPLGLPADRNKSRPSMDTGVREHVFQQHSTMRFTRCEHCNDKMWGLQELRCAVCGIVCHAKCAEKLQNNCSPATHSRGAEAIPEGPPVQSMFGRELSEQVQADKRAVPGIVTKCIKAVEANGMDYEGIYRKSGGSSQSKLITQLFERDDLDSFDLEDLDTFNDISSITSVLKTYFRELPNPLLTHELHESFVAATEIKDAESKNRAMTALIEQLPKDHYNTLRVLMLHLNRVQSKSSVNLMNARNIGTVFGPTLMRSPETGREFGDMGGKTLAIAWMVDNAVTVFAKAA